MNPLSRPKIPLQIIGGGAAGMGMVLALCNRIAAVDHASPEQQILQALQIFEAGDHLGGVMGSYRVNANTTSHDVVKGIADGTPFVPIRDSYLQHAETQSRVIPLYRIDSLMVQPLAAAMQEFLGSRLRFNTRIERIEITPEGFQSFDQQGCLLADSRNLLLCCGGCELLFDELTAFADKTVFSGDFIRQADSAGLPQGKGPIVIVGASHSAFSCAWRLLYDPVFEDFLQQREIYLLTRRNRIKLRCTPEFAVEHGISYDHDQDFCTKTGLVFANGGLRKDAKQLYLDIRDGRETRVELVAMHTLSDQQALLQRAGLILQSGGFNPNLPAINQSGMTVKIGKPNNRGELTIQHNNQIIRGLFGMGMGMNIVPPEAQGEASFYGGIHGFQSYPLSIAPPIIDGIKSNL